MIEYFGLENSVDYRKFIRTALKYADSIGVSYTSDYSAFKESKWWEILGESVIRCEYDDSGTLTVYLKIDHFTYDWLRAKKDVFDFWDWDIDDNILWDLCLYKDGEAIVTTVTHEQLQYISQEFYNKYIEENK